MPASTKIPTSPEPHDPSALKLALDRLRPQLLAIPNEEVATVPRVDPAFAVAIVNGSLARIAVHRDAVVAELGEERAAFLDALPVAVRAAWQANVEAAGEAKLHDVRSVHAELAVDHQLLLIDAEALARRGLLPRDRVDAGRRAKGYRTVATSVLVLVALFREVWPRLEGSTAVTFADLARLEKKALHVLDVVDGKDRQSLPRPARDLRTRALVHLLSVYAEVRRMIGFVRYYHRDEDAIAPSPYSGRQGRARARRASTDGTKAGAPSGPAAPGPGREGPFTE